MSVCARNRKKKIKKHVSQMCCISSTSTKRCRGDKTSCGSICSTCTKCQRACVRRCSRAAGGGGLWRCCCCFKVREREVRSADIPQTSQQSLKFPPLMSVLLLFLPLFPASLCSLPRLICNMCSFNTERGKGPLEGP